MEDGELMESAAARRAVGGIRRGGRVAWFFGADSGDVETC